MTRAWSGPAAAATLAEAPQASTNQNTVSWPVNRSASSAGSIAAAQTMSFRKAWLPRPSAKNANRQLSWSISPGIVRPIATKATFAVPPSSTAKASIAAPPTRPTASAVPVQLLTARRQARVWAPLNLTRSGSVDSPREAFSTNE